MVERTSRSIYLESELRIKQDHTESRPDEPTPNLSNQTNIHDHQVQTKTPNRLPPATTLPLLLRISLREQKVKLPF